MSNSDLYTHTRSDKIKWIITAIAFILVFVVVAGICIHLFRKDTEETPESTTFNLDVMAIMELTDEDFEDSIPITLAQFLGNEGGEDDTPFAYIHLISYNESDEELVLFASTVDLSLGILVRSKDFTKEELPKLAKSKAILQEYFFQRQYEAYLCGADTSNLIPKAYWVNMSILWLGDMFGDMDNLSDFAIDAPSAVLQFDAEGTHKPSDKIMTAITGK